jgi:hypothetical protein
MSSLLLSIAPEIVSLSKEDYKPLKRKRLFLSKVDRFYSRIDNTFDDNSSDDSSPIRPRLAIRSRARENSRGRTNPSTILRTSGTRSLPTTERIANSVCTLCDSPPIVR